MSLSLSLSHSLTLNYWLNANFLYPCFHRILFSALTRHQHHEHAHFLSTPVTQSPAQHVVLRLLFLLDLPRCPQLDVVHQHSTQMTRRRHISHQWKSTRWLFPVKRSLLISTIHPCQSAERTTNQIDGDLADSPVASCWTFSDPCHQTSSSFDIRVQKSTNWECSTSYLYSPLYAL